LRQITSILEEMSGEVEVQHAATAEHGLQALRGQDHDILLIPAYTEGVHVVELVARALEARPGLTVVVQAASVSEDVSRLHSQADTVQVIDARIDPVHLRSLLAGISESADSSRTQLDVLDVLLLMTLAADSRTIRIQFGEERGTLSFDEGSLAYAATRGLRGEDAFSLMASQGPGVIEETLHADPRRYHVNIRLSLAQLVDLSRRAKAGPWQETSEPSAHQAPIAQNHAASPEIAATEAPQPFETPRTLYDEDRTPGGGEEMNIEKLKESVDVLRDDLGVALEATDIFDQSGLSYAGYNEQPAATALFADITQKLRKLLSDAGFPALGNYYLVELEDGKMVVMALVKELHWGILVDGNKVNLGVLLNVAMPKAIQNLKSAM
jgi:hypothetical protein